MKRTAVLLLALAALLPAGAQAAFPGRNGAIVFGEWSQHWVGDTEGGGYFYDGSGVNVRIRAGERHTLASCQGDRDPWCTSAQFGDPAVSPDGRLVALRAGDGLALVGIHGGTRDLLPHPGASCSAPAFSPGGRRLAFESSADDMSPELWTSDLDGGRAHRVVRVGLNPAWSSRNWIAFEDEDGGISRVRPDGHGLRSLVDRGQQPTWAPDGRHVAFIGLHKARHGIFTMRGDGRQVRRVPFDGLVYDLAWSPDGRKLLIAGEPLRSNAALLTIDLRTGARAVLVRAADGLDGFRYVDWQPLRR